MPTQELVVAAGRLAANHLWQSTGFAAVAVVLALALRANHARVRYWLWMAASVKFLVPFSVLAAVGSQLGRWLVPATPVARVPLVMAQIVQPFATVQGDVLRVAPSMPAPSFAHLLPALLVAIWVCGFAVVVVYGWTRWRRVAAVVRSSPPLREGREAEALRRAVVGQAGSLRRVGNPPERRLPTGAQLAKLPHIDLVSSTARLEPGIFGIFRPVLWLPSGIGDRLGDAELEAILAHELCHARRRDNLAAVIHMAVEAIFWFHPLVWWLGARLVEERERACDEDVVRLGGEPQVYAESILKVCEFYLASPTVCVAGVTGGELKKRIEGIMTNRFMRRLSFGKTLLLAVAGIAAVAGPITIGLLNAPRIRAQSPARKPALSAAAPAGAQASAPAPAAASKTASAAQPAKAFAQHAAPPPSFEVASVKPVEEPRGALNTFSSSGPRVRYVANSIVNLVMEAYKVKHYQVIFAPKVTPPTGGVYNPAYYDIEAKAEGDFARTRDEFRPMLQTLLAERFNLKVHREMREMPVYALMVAKNGPKFKESAPDATYSFLHGVNGLNQNITASKATMEALAEGIRDMVWLDPPVVDKTGLTGTYDFKIEATSESRLNRNPDDPAAVSVFDAVQDQLGLKLERQKAMIEVLVVDHIEKPSAN